MILILRTGTEENLLELRDLDDGEDSVKFHLTWPASKLLSEELPGMIEDALSSLELGFDDISGVVGFRGPGSYTGLRIGITVINAIADQVNAPIVGETGDNWQEDGLARLRSGENDKIILPEYGGEANITRPRK
jgi:tRNA threonylcarbamoyladenosine biosynthesis protein TsaB